MEYRTHWHFKDGKNKGSENAVDCSIDQIIELARELKDDDVIYTYHPNYIALGARVAIWGTQSEKVCIDIQYSSSAAVKEILISEINGYFINYENIIKEPEMYGLTIEE